MSLLTDFLFAEAQTGKPVEFLMKGTFQDRHGRTVEVPDKDLDIYVANFANNAAGQMVPVDVNHRREESAGWLKRVWRQGDKLLADVDWNALGHQLVGDKVYLYFSATLDTVKKVIKSISLVNFPAVKGLKPVELSEGVYSLQVAPGLVEALVGRVSQVVMEVLGRGESSQGEEALRRERQIQYFKHRQTGEFEEAWVELQGNIKAIVGAWRRWAGSFDKCARELKGKPGIDDPEKLCAWLHKQAEGKWPAEASDHSPTVVELEALVTALSDVIQSGGNDMTDEERAELKEQLRQELLAEMAEQEKTIADLREQARAEVEAEMAEKFRKRDELRKFAEEITSGDFGLATKPEEIVELLASIEDEEQLKRVQEILEAKVVDFTEHGSSRDGQGGKQELPSAYAVLVRAWQEDGHSLAEFFEVNKDELGSMDQYVLSEFEKQK